MIFSEFSDIVFPLNATSSHCFKFPCLRSPCQPSLSIIIFCFVSARACAMQVSTNSLNLRQSSLPTCVTVEDWRWHSDTLSHNLVKSRELLTTSRQLILKWLAMNNILCCCLLLLAVLLITEINIIFNISVFVYLAADGVTYTLGIFYVEFLDYFKSGKAETSWIASILVGVTLCSGNWSALKPN